MVLPKIPLSMRERALSRRSSGDSQLMRNEENERCSPTHAKAIMKTSNYQTDFYTWTQQQAEILKSGRFSEADLENIIEEIRSMGRSEKRALESRLSILMLHLLKWQYQPGRRGNSWKFSIAEQRHRFQKVLKQNPGLKSEIGEVLADAYEYAALKATHETGLRTDIFPSSCPWTLDQLSDSGFYPD
jgi:hypothetical protein